MRDVSGRAVCELTSGRTSVKVCLGEVNVKRRRVWLDTELSRPILDELRDLQRNMKLTWADVGESVQVGLDLE
jgi:hypothetical protein